MKQNAPSTPITTTTTAATARSASLSLAANLGAVPGFSGSTQAKWGCWDRIWKWGANMKGDKLPLPLLLFSLDIKEFVFCEGEAACIPLQP